MTKKLSVIALAILAALPAARAGTDMLIDNSAQTAPPPPRRIYYTPPPPPPAFVVYPRYRYYAPVRFYGYRRGFVRHFYHRHRWP